MTYFSRLKDQDGDSLISKFYMLAKVHKNPWKTRPVVATCGTIWHGISRWADYYLKKFIPFIPSYTKDCFQVKKELEELGTLPPGTFLATMDATAMYTNICTDHGLKVLEQIMKMLAHNLSADFPLDLVMHAMTLIMRFNVFEAGDTFHHQISGTAMGTPSAVTYATLYYGCHEITKLLVKYMRHLVYYKRYIDDKCILWNNYEVPDAWDNFVKDVNDFGLLKWKVERKGREVNFLDLTITINDSGRIETRTYQKPMNLYLYIPAASAHPLGVGKAMVYGSLRRYYLQNTHRKDYLKQIKLLFVRMKARGWSPELLKELMVKAAASLELPKPTSMITELEDDNNNDRLFIHMKYHTRGINSKSELFLMKPVTISTIQQQRLKE